MPKLDLSTSPRAIWHLTWPQMLMMYLMFFTGFIGVWVAGQISSNVQASLGLVTQCAMFLMVVIMAVSSGATACISQSLGAGRMIRAQLYIFSTIVGSRDIWKIAVLTLPVQYVNSATGVMFRATRMVMPPLFVAAIVCVINLFLNLGLGLGFFGFPNYSYQGLMWANMFSQIIGSILNLVLLKRSGYLQFNVLPTPAWLKGAMPYLIRVALPAGAASIVWQSGYLTLFVLVASLPTGSIAALAGLTAGLRAEGLIFMPSMALQMTTSILVGNSLGQGKPEQARALGLRMAMVGALAMTVMAAVLWPFRQEMAEILSQEVETQAQIVSYLSYNLAGTPFSIASQIMGGIMVGAGATQYNLVIYGGTFWAVRLPLGWLLGHKLWGTASGIFAAMIISQIIQATIMLCAVKYCNWMRFAMKVGKNRTS